MRRKEGKLEDGEPTLEEMQIELPLEELKPHEEEENQERTIEEIAKDIPISSVMKAGGRRGCKNEKDLSVGDINPYTRSMSTSPTVSECIRAGSDMFRYNDRGLISGKI